MSGEGVRGGSESLRLSIGPARWSLCFKLNRGLAKREGGREGKVGVRKIEMLEEGERGGLKALLSSSAHP